MEDDGTILEQHAPAIQMQSERPVDPSVYCPVCSKRLESRKCKLLCPVCGYYLSCSDYY